MMAFSSHASFYQSHCSNPQATIVYANGHVNNYLKVGVIGDKENKLHELNLRNLDAKTLQDSTISSVSRCSGYFYEQTKLSLKKIRFNNSDGSEFSENFFGLSADKKFIDVTYLCEYKMNSRANCSN